MYQNRTSAFICLLLILAVGVYLRILPLYNTNGRVHFKYDQALHMRMVLEVFENGRIPAIDYLTLYPEGRNISKELPTLLYYSGAYFNKLAGVFKKGVTPLDSVVYFCAIIGALIAIPVYFISLALLGDRRYALLAALLSAIFLPYLVRTLCYLLRYDGMGSLLLLASVSFLIASLRQKQPYKNIIYSILSGFMLISAIATWRMSLVVFLLIIAGAILTMALRCSTINVLRSYGIIILMGLSSFLFIPYLASGGSHGYSGILHMAFLKLTNVFVGNNAEGFNQLLLDIEELQSLPLLALLGKERFSLAGLFPFLYIGYILKQGGFFKTDKNSAAINIIFTFFVLTLFGLTILFRRFQVLLSPLIAISTTGVLQNSVYNFKNIKIKTRIMHLVIFLIASITCLQMSFTAHAYARHLGSVFDGPTLESLKWINGSTPKNSPILTYWTDGYAVQLYTGRPTIMDGLLEDRKNQERIMEAGKAMYSTDEIELYNLCKKYSAKYILLPANQIRGYALTVAPTASKDPNAVLFKLLNSPEKSNYFILRNRNEKYLIYERL